MARRNADPLARMAQQAANNGQCREAAVFLDHALRLGGGAETRAAETVMSQSCPVARGYGALRVAKRKPTKRKHRR